MNNTHIEFKKGEIIATFRKPQVRIYHWTTKDRLILHYTDGRWEYYSSHKKPDAWRNEYDKELKVYWRWDTVEPKNYVDLKFIGYL